MGKTNEVLAPGARCLGEALARSLLLLLVVMLRNAVHRFWLTLAIVPLMTGVAMAAQPLAFLCRDDAVVRRICCCARPQAQAPARDGEIQAACCCDLVAASIPMVPAAAPAPTRVAMSPHAAVVALLGVLRRPRLAPTARLRSTRSAQPPPPLPILLQKQSLLI